MQHLRLYLTKFARPPVTQPTYHLPTLLPALPLPNLPLQKCKSTSFHHFSTLQLKCVRIGINFTVTQRFLANSLQKVALSHLFFRIYSLPSKRMLFCIFEHSTPHSNTLKPRRCAPHSYQLTKKNLHLHFSVDLKVFHLSYFI